MQRNSPQKVQEWHQWLEQIELADRIIPIDTCGWKGRQPGTVAGEGSPNDTCTSHQEQPAPSLLGAYPEKLVTEGKDS